MITRQKSLFLIFLLVMTVLCTAQNMFIRYGQSQFMKDAGVSAGISLGDYDNDGYPDVFVANWQNQKNFLYHNNGEGTFTRIMEGPIAQDRGYSSGPAWGDYDNDGYLDLFVANQQHYHNFLYHNNGEGTFTKITDGDIVNDFGDSYSAVWGDYNNDGFLDLFVANGSHDNFLYQNNSNGSFTKIKDSPVVKDGGSSYGAAWGDYNNDGWLDLFVANRHNEVNFLYQNQGDGTFKRIEKGVFKEDKGNSNGGSWADFDNDGDLDLLVTNGNFYGKGEKNFLYKNNGEGTFNKMTEGIIGTDLTKSMSGLWEDFDADGDLDLLVSTYTHDNTLYFNKGDGTFKKNNREIMVNFAGYGTGMGAGDYDNDGDLDVFMANWENQNNELYQNNLKPKNWLKIRLQTQKLNRFAVGAKICLQTEKDGKTHSQMREINGGHGFRSQSSTDVYFGIGKDHQVKSLKVSWPSGNQKEYIINDPGVTLVILEGKGVIDQIKAKVEKTSLAMALYRIYNKKGEAVMFQRYFEIIEKEKEKFDCSENELNRIGNYLLNGLGKVAVAKKLFKLNLENFPESIQSLIGLAGVAVKEKNHSEAKIYFKKALNLLLKDTKLTKETREILINTVKYEMKNIK